MIIEVLRSITQSEEPVMAKKKTKEAAEMAPEGATATAEPAKKLSKIAMVCEAQDALGSDATPTTIQAFIKEKHGIEPTVNHISNIRSQLRKKASGAVPKKRGPKPKVEANGHAANGHAANGSTYVVGEGYTPAKDMTVEGSVSLADMATVKELVRRYSTDVLHELVNVVG
jgi:hypothetical protein